METEYRIYYRGYKNWVVVICQIYDDGTVSESDIETKATFEDAIREISYLMQNNPDIGPKFRGVRVL